MQTITEHEKTFSKLLAACTSWAGVTTAKLEELLRPGLAEGESMPDLALVQKLFGRALERHWQQLLHAHDGVEDAVSRHRTLLGERDAAVRTLYGLLSDLRAYLRRYFGASVVWLLALRGETSRDPVVLLRQADRAVNRLRNLSRPLPAVVIKLSRRQVASATDREAWAAPVADAAEVLRRLVAQASLAAKAVDMARFDRRQALKGYNATFLNVAGWLEATYRAAGLEKLAKKVRPSKRTRVQIYRQTKKLAEREAKRDKITPGKLAAPAASEPAGAGRVLPFEPLRRAFRRIRRAG